MYFEIQADEPPRAMGFYSHVFGWKFTKQEGLPIEYWRIETDAYEGGLLTRPGRRAPIGSGTNAFVCSIEVHDFDAAAGRILEKDGIVALPKFPVPGRCWQGYFIDT